jgi:hypothetical protein
VKIELDSVTNVITVDGLMIHLDLLKNLANPDPSQLYRMRREGDVTIIEIVVLSGALPAPEPCQSIFAVSPQEKIICKLLGNHASCHVGNFNGVRITWTDDLVQCSEDSMRDGTLAEPRT